MTPETTRIDVIMYKITEASHADGLIRAVKRGVPVRLIVEPSFYRDNQRVAGVPGRSALLRPACRFESARTRASRIRRPSCYTGRR